MKFTKLSTLLILSLLPSEALHADVVYNFTTIQVPGAMFTEATALNNTGQIVGDYSTGGPTVGFLYSNGAISQLDFSGSAVTTPFGINDQGQIVGSFAIPGGLAQGFVYQNGMFTAINIPGSEYSFANGINNLGQIAGFVRDSTGDHGFIDTNGVFQLFDVPGVQVNQPNAINDHGQVVGTVIGSQGYEGFLYDHGLITLINVPGADQTLPFGINDAGQIVGFYYVGTVETGVVRYGFVLDSGIFTTIDIANMGGILGVNNAGQIVGFAGQYGFLGTPVPEPTSLFLVALALASIATRVCRVRNVRACEISGQTT